LDCRLGWDHHAIAAGLAIVGAIINFATAPPAMRLVAVAWRCCVFQELETGASMEGKELRCRSPNGILNLTIGREM